jgi:hypothetical protein
MSDKTYGRSQQDIGWWTFRRLEEEAAARRNQRTMQIYHRGEADHRLLLLQYWSRPTIPLEKSDAVSIRANRRRHAAQRLFDIELKQAAREAMGGKDPLVDWLIENLLPERRDEFGEILYVMPRKMETLMDLAGDCHWTICDTFHDLLVKAERDGVL